jgi:hypothetical protein
MGDFVDLWRERPMFFKMKKAEERTGLYYQKVLEDHETLSRRLFGPELGTRRVHGNHDFDTHELETCIGSELRYYFPYDAETYPVGRNGGSSHWWTAGPGWKKATWTGRSCRTPRSAFSMTTTSGSISFPQKTVRLWKRTAATLSVETKPGYDLQPLIHEYKMPL